MVDKSPIIASKHTFADRFAEYEPIEVEAPELGEGVVVRFRPSFTVSDLAAVTATEGFDNLVKLELLLAQCTLCDEHGNRLVDPESPKWFDEGCDGVVMARLAKRAGLVERFLKVWKAGTDDEVVESGNRLLDDPHLRRLIAQVAVAMKTAPHEIMGWSMQEFKDLLDAMKQPSKKQDRPDGKGTEDAPPIG